MGFTDFYAKYPRKKSRFEAEKAYGQILRKGVTHEQIMVGLERYLRHLPEDVKWIPYPASWLRAGSFLDEYEVERPVASDEGWFEECAAIHGGECGLNRSRHAQRKWMDAYKAREAV